MTFPSATLDLPLNEIVFNAKYSALQWLYLSLTFLHRLNNDSPNCIYFNARLFAVRLRAKQNGRAVAAK